MAVSVRGPDYPVNADAVPATRRAGIRQVTGNVGQLEYHASA